MFKLSRYYQTGRLTALQSFDGGTAYVLGGYVLRLVRLVVLLLVWKALLAGGADAGGMTLSQVLTYTLLSSVLAEQLDVESSAATAFWNGSLQHLYLRPMPVVAQLVAETAGKWVPSLLLYSLPMLAVAPLLGVPVLPVSPARGLLFVPSLLMAISLGFAVDLMFSALAVRMKNASWMAYAIRRAIASIFSGALIPFALLPWGLGPALELLPFASLAGAPLAIYAGGGDVMKLLAAQLVWNAALWPLALLVFRKSQERMVSYGG